MTTFRGHSGLRSSQPNWAAPNGGKSSCRRNWRTLLRAERLFGQAFPHWLNHTGVFLMYRGGTNVTYEKNYTLWCWDVWCQFKFWMFLQVLQKMLCNSIEKKCLFAYQLLFEVTIKKDCSVCYVFRFFYYINN